MSRKPYIRSIVCALAWALALPVAGADAQLRAGAASADITPAVGTPMFAYTARSGVANPTRLPSVLMNLFGDPGSGHYAKTFVPSEGIHLRILTRALVLEQGGRTWALAQADLGGLPYTLVQDVLDRVADIGITADTLLLSATHTHASAGPIWPTESNLGYAALGGDLFDPRVYGEIRDGVVKAIRDAHAAMVPAKAGFAVSQITNASRNRSYESFLRDPETPKDKTAARLASIDPDMTVLRVDATNGSPIAVWSNFAVHPTTFGDENALFSGDNAGDGTRLAEAKVTAEAAKRGRPAKRPFVDVWSNAAEGDISPSGDPDVIGGQKVQSIPNDYASANLAGERQARGILRAWRTAGASLSEAFSIQSRRTLISFDGTPADGEPVGPLQSLGYGGVLGDGGVCSPLGGVNIPGQAPKLPGVTGILLAPSTVPVSVWRMGSLGIVALPSEVTKTMGQRIRNASFAAASGAFGKVVIAGLANGYVSYTATPEEYDACEYEGSFTLFGRQQGARWRNVATALTHALAQGRNTPPGASEPIRLRVGLGGNAPRVTPGAGKIVRQPKPTVARFDRATFSWTGGDPAVDAPHDRAFVTLERQATGGHWVAVGTDDGLRDTTVLKDGTWTDTWQFSQCDALGSYRFNVTGNADRGAGVRGYELTSDTFRLGALAPLQLGELTVSRTRVAGVLITYPDPGKNTLLALPRLMRSGRVTVAYLTRAGRYRSVSAKAPRGTTPAWSVRLPRGAKRVSVARAQDGCGNQASSSAASG